MTGGPAAGYGPPTVWIRRTGGMRADGAALLTSLLGVPVERDRTGRPWVPRGDIHVSISHHAGRTAVAATTLGPIGIDIETVRRVPARALAERWFDPAEARYVAGLPEHAQSDAFLRLWTLKEAVGKALGVGLRGGGMRRVVGFPPPPQRSIAPRAEPSAERLADPGDGAGVLLLASLPHVPGMCGAVFTHGDLIVAVTCHGAAADGVRVTVDGE